MVLMALARTGSANTPAARPAVERALRWLLGMQNRDGGWAAFDRDVTREVLTKVPFADHNAMLDPSCPDITARVLEALGEYGFGADHPQVGAALAFLRKTQERSGCWLGRWGVNYLYGVWQVLVGLEKIGFDMADPMVRRAVAWLESVQQQDGGWGESCGSYDDPTLAGAGHADRLADGLGLAGADGGGRGGQPGRARRHRLSWSRRRTTTAAGGRSRSPAPASRRSFT